MEVKMILSSVFEFLLVAFTIWAVLHEDKFAAFERKIIARVRRRKMHVIRTENYGAASCYFQNR